MTTTAAIPVVVIGSGPAGTAATKALLARGLTVTLLDVGTTMPADARAVRDTMEALRPDEWDRQEIGQRNRSSLRERGGVPLKTVFGSPFPYHFHPDVSHHGATILGSHARGGLSNAWGASILPLSERDMHNWPLSPDDLAPHYEAILQWLPHAQVRDELADTYPLYSTFTRRLAVSNQGKALMKDLRAVRSSLNECGIHFGQSRLALSNCFYCRQCLHGCPYDFIYSTNETLNDLEGHPGFTYRDNAEVVAIEEHSDTVTLRLRDGDSVTAGRVFVGAGVLHSALLLLPLLRRESLVIKDSAYGLVPFLRYQRTSGVEEEQLHTLPQMFMEVDVPEVSARNVHLQWYSYNDFYREELRKKLGVFFNLLPNFVPRQFVERMWSIQAFLHSDDSPDLRLSLHNGKAALEVIPNTATAGVFSATYSKLAKLGRMFGGRTLPMLARPGVPGGSFHSGAALPMHTNPGELQSDLLGRPHGLQRVHVIDATVFPDIASSTITLSVMANAHRIASEYYEHHS